MRVLLAAPLLLLVLASCMGPAVPVTATLGATALAYTPTPTLAPYWELLPMTTQPERGWKTYQSDELDFTFQYPAVYDDGVCGQVWVEDKYWRDPPVIAVGLSSINMYVIETWSGDLADQASMFTSRPEVQVLSAVEPFSIDGLPALRFIYRGRGGLNMEVMPDTDYIKRAYVAFAGRLYEFVYHHLAHVRDCDAPPLSEEAVYEYLLSTVQFKQ